MSDAPPAEAIAPPAADVPAFPTDDSLCESCGYSLRGLTGSERCPECGTPLAESDPARRVGLPWQNKMSVKSWLKTTWMMVVAPRRAFRIMRVSPSIAMRDWAYLGIFAGLGGVILGVTLHLLTERMIGTRSWPQTTWLVRLAEMVWASAFGGCIVAAALTMIEARGVAWVAKRRAWRVPYRLAFLICCYSAVGWLFSAILCAIAAAVTLSSELFFSATLTVPRYWFLFVPVIIFAISILWFETLVWLGVRQVRYANFAYPAGANLTR